MKKLLLLLFIPIVCLSQQEQIIYYDSEWKGTSRVFAEYYRIYSLNENGDPIGKIKDFYSSGELQSEIDGAIYIDKDDDSKSKFIGKTVGYYKSGTREFVNENDNNGKPLRYKSWYKNGNTKYIVNYKNGEFDGLTQQYYASGKLYRQFKYKNGELEGKFYIECDDFDRCQNIFYESFDSTENLNEWVLKSENDHNIEIIPNKGQSIKVSRQVTIQSSIYIPLNLNDDFSIETLIEETQPANFSAGLLWGFKDWDNYNFFIISNDKFRMDTKTEGIFLNLREWTKSDKINNNGGNKLKILKKGNNIFYSINGSVVGSLEYYSLAGNNIGFFGFGPGEALFKNLIVKQNTSELSNNLVNESSTWKGNGSGIIISKSGYIVTNYHVIEDTEKIEVEFVIDGEVKKFNADVVQSDKVNDLAIIKIFDVNFDGLDNLPYNFKARSSDVGTKVYAFGYPMALSVMGKEIKITDGIISSKSGYDGDITTYQISAPIQGGNSGGPLFDDMGNFLGINSSKLGADFADNVGYTIKSSYVLNLIDVLPKSIDLPSSTKLQSLPLTEQIKEISKYVVLVKVK